MGAIEIKPLEGLDARIAAPSSKAHTLRALFTAALADGKSLIQRPLLAEDQMLAIGALKQFGIGFKKSGDSLAVSGTGGLLELPKETVYAGNSGLTIRLLVSFAALAPKGKIVIDGSERMRTGRPIQDLLDALRPLGINAVSLAGNGCPPVELQGGSFAGGKTSMDGSKSSQYISSILISAPYAKKQTVIGVSGKLRSRPYIDVTLAVMNDFGISAKNEDYEKFTVEPGQKYRARAYAVEGDYSSASFFFSAAAITGGKMRVENLNPKSAQGDKFFLECLEKMGCEVKFGADHVIVEGAEKLRGISVDMNDYPDIVMPLAVTAAFADGKTEIRNVAHLRLKESDRLKATADELRKMGCRVSETEDSLVVHGRAEKLHGAEIETYDDHRIAMSFSIAGLRAGGMRIRNPDCVKKSFPDFYEKLNSLYGREARR